MSTKIMDHNLLQRSKIQNSQQKLPNIPRFPSGFQSPSIWRRESLAFFSNLNEVKDDSADFLYCEFDDLVGDMSVDGVNIPTGVLKETGSIEEDVAEGEPKCSAVPPRVLKPKLVQTYPSSIPTTNTKDKPNAMAKSGQRLPHGDNEISTDSIAPTESRIVTPNKNYDTPPVVAKVAKISTGLPPGKFANLKSVFEQMSCGSGPASPVSRLDSNSTSKKLEVTEQKAANSAHTIALELPISKNNPKSEAVSIPRPVSSLGFYPRPTSSQGQYYQHSGCLKPSEERLKNINKRKNDGGESSSNCKIQVQNPGATKMAEKYSKKELTGSSISRINRSPSPLVKEYASSIPRPATAMGYRATKISRIPRKC
ncbi:uncharacterized protein VTP21DRAFT_6287 [Calcarisporiella thermophila]|uniref:uncharacterized protein n=1 Tax=Calcarisporiella thermophila TaxID=911321 RepID=UPI0037434AAD